MPRALAKWIASTAAITRAWVDGAQHGVPAPDVSRPRSKVGNQ